MDHKHQGLEQIYLNEGMFAWSFPPWNQTDHSFVNSNVITRLELKTHTELHSALKSHTWIYKCSSHIIRSAKLAIWLKQVNVVGAHIVFYHSNDGSRKTLLTVMISWMLRHRTRKLRNFCFLDKVPLDIWPKRIFVCSSCVPGCTCRRCYIRYIFVHLL